jgi:hypothetical protein
MTHRQRYPALAHMDILDEVVRVASSHVHDLRGMTNYHRVPLPPGVRIKLTVLREELAVGLKAIDAMLHDEVPR